MPLTSNERQFLTRCDRFKYLLVVLALALLLYVAVTPVSDFSMPTFILAVAFCVTFWVTQRLLTLIMVLDVELTKTVRALQRLMSGQADIPTSLEVKKDPPATP